MEPERGGSKAVSSSVKWEHSWTSQGCPNSQRGYLCRDAAWERTQEEPSPGGWCPLSIMATAAAERTRHPLQPEGRLPSRGTRQWHGEATQSLQPVGRCAWLVPPPDPQPHCSLSKRPSVANDQWGRRADASPKRASSQAGTELI